MRDGTYYLKVTVTETRLTLFETARCATTTSGVSEAAPNFRLTLFETARCATTR